MIPKIIHYTWFSGDDFPSKISNCISSWKEHLKDYEFRLWDMESIRDIDSLYLRQALDCKKWACASDYVRLYALKTYGGIYLDTDVMLYKSFDEFLGHEVFIGSEHSIHYDGLTERYLTSHCMGAVNDNPFINKCLSYFENKIFLELPNAELPKTLKYRMIFLPYVQSEIAKSEGYNPSALLDKLQTTQSGLIIYPSCYFDAAEISQETVCKHLAVGGWREYEQYNPKISLRYKFEWRWQKFLQKLLGKNFKVVRLR